MKSIFGVIGVLALVLVCLSGTVRQQVCDWFQHDYQQVGYNGTDASCAPGDGSCIDGNVAPINQYGPQYGQRDVRTSFGYESVRSAPIYNQVWVAPEYRRVVQYGQYRTVLVRQGYYRQVVVPARREKHVGFDLGAILTSFRR